MVSPRLEIIRSGSVTSTIRGRNSEISVDMKLDTVVFSINDRTFITRDTVIKHDGHLRTRGKCRKHEPLASVFYISRVFSNARSVLSHVIHGLGFFILLHDIDFTRAKQ